MTEVSPNSNKRVLARGKQAIIALGFSARGLASAISQTGQSVVALDRFGDLDLQETCDSYVTVNSWNEAFTASPPQVAGAGQQSVGNIVTKLELLAPSRLLRSWPVLLAGGTENWSDLVHALHKNFFVLGPNKRQLARLRSARFWQRAARYAQLEFPETIFPDSSSSSLNLENIFRDKVALRSIGERRLPSSWLLKSIHSAGGLRIRRVQCMTEGEWPTTERRQYLQREVVGRSLGVTCILRDPKSTTDSSPACLVLAATESLSATDWLGPAEFTYRGSCGPIRLSDQQTRQIRKLAEYIQAHTGLIGWLQVDLIEDNLGALWLLEINPRWTAGMEVLCDAGINPVQFHLDATHPGLRYDGSPSKQSSHRICQVEPSFGRANDGTTIVKEHLVAKGIVYAERDFMLSKPTLHALQKLPRDAYADIPSDAQEHCIAEGHPILTVKTRIPRDVDYESSKRRALEQLRRQRLHILRIAHSSHSIF